MRLYDRIRCQMDSGESIINPASRSYSLLYTSPVIDVQNVLPLQGTGLELPYLLPPFPSFFMEYRQENHNVGLLFDAQERTANSPEFGTIPTWAWVVSVFTEEYEWAITLLAYRYFFISYKHSGAWAVLDTDGRKIQNLIDTRTGDIREDRRAQENLPRLFRLVEPGLLGMCFMNLSNTRVSIVTPEQRLPRHIRRRYQTDRPLTNYSIIEVGKPTKRSISNFPASNSGIQRSLHICRGHFATYTEDKKLFGKYTGRFWIPAHSRGNASVGVSNHDYKVVQ